MSNSNDGNQNNEGSSTPNPSPNISTGSSKVFTSNNRKRSWVWAHFTPDPKAHGRSLCVYCGISIASLSTSGTSALINHLNRCEKYSNNKREDNRQKKLVGYVTNNGSDGGTGESAQTLGMSVFNAERARKQLAKMIIIDELPFKFVEREGFKDIVHELQPKFVIPSRFTVARDCYGLYLEEKKVLKKVLSNLPGRICLTTDTWTSCQNLNYMCLTAHYVNEHWKLCKKILNFCPISGNSREIIGRYIVGCLVDWDIKNVFAVTVDNASSNDLGIQYLRTRLNSWSGCVLDGKFLHVRCAAHILSLVVRDGLIELDDSIIRIRNAVKYVRSSPARMARFKECVESSKIDSKSLIYLDVETRWNSTYLMLESALKFEKAFDLLVIHDSKYVDELTKESNNNSKGVGVPCRIDWDNVRNLLPFLKLFYDAILKLSSSHTVTSNEYMKEILGIGLLIATRCNASDNGVRNMALRMKRKYDKYWGNIENINVMIFIAVVLDPRKKLKHVNYIIGKCYDFVMAEILKEMVKNVLLEMFDFYSSSQSSSMPSKSWHQIVNDARTIDEMMLALDDEEDETEEVNCNELERYLKDERELKDADIDILAFWRKSSSKYPILSRMARDVLAMPVSIVASESAFSTGGRVLDSFRSSLTPRMTEALICAQDWLRKSPTSFSLEEKLEEIERIESGMLFAEHEHKVIMIQE